MRIGRAQPDAQAGAAAVVNCMPGCLLCAPQRPASPQCQLLLGCCCCTIITAGCCWPPIGALDSGRGGASASAICRQGKGWRKGRSADAAAGRRRRVAAGRRQRVGGGGR